MRHCFPSSSCADTSALQRKWHKLATGLHCQASEATTKHHFSELQLRDFQFAGYPRLFLIRADFDFWTGVWFSMAHMARLWVVAVLVGLMWVMVSHGWLTPRTSFSIHDNGESRSCLLLIKAFSLPLQLKFNCSTVRHEGAKRTRRNSGWEFELFGNIWNFFTLKLSRAVFLSTLYPEGAHDMCPSIFGFSSALYGDTAC